MVQQSLTNILACTLQMLEFIGELHEMGTLVLTNLHKVKGKYHITSTKTPLITHPETTTCSVNLTRLIHGLSKF